MACQIKVAEISSHKQVRGGISEIRDEPCAWGRMEGRPNFVTLRIKDAQAADLAAYAEQLQILATYAIESWPAYHEVTATISANAFQRFNRKFETATKSYLEAVWGATFTTFSDLESVFRVPPEADLAHLVADVSDKFAAPAGPRYQVTNTLVARAAKKAEGLLEMTRAELEAELIDRLA